jgi:release factor glutamine methyltransferase
MMPATIRAETIREALAAAVARLGAAGVPEPRADAEVLLAHVLGVGRAALVVRADESLAHPARDRFGALVARRAAREPAAYITGEREFWSLPLRVDRRALIPRPETELVVATALRVAPRARRVLDVGTGSGAIALALSRELPGAFVTASDRFPPALEVAAANAARLAPGVRLVRGDLTTTFRAATFDLVVSNPPYCPQGTVVQAEVRDYEPGTALYAGMDGLRVLDRLVAMAPSVLVAGGWLVVEVGAGQAPTVAERCRSAGHYDRVEVARDLAGIERVIAARVPRGG